MLRKLLLLVAAILFFSALTFGIFAHVTYTVNGAIDDTVVGFATAGMICLVVAGIIIRRVTRDKPLDLAKSISHDFKRVQLGGLLASFGVLVLGIFTPLMYDLFEKEAARAGSGAAITDLPLAVQPALIWLRDTFGSAGLITPVIAFGLILIVTGWQLIRPARRKAAPQQS